MRNPATWWAAAACIACLLASAVPARADDDLVAQVIVDSTTLRSGPGGNFRRVWVAHRDDVFPIRKRATRGYWFRVELPDGTNGWIQGDAVYPRELTEGESGGRFLPWLFAPPPLPQATGEIAVTFGILGQGGFMALRPTLLLSPELGIEAQAAASVATGGRILMGGLGGIVNLFPKSPVVPFVVVGGGFAVSDPNADTFLLESGTTGMLYGGGGLRFCFRYRITLRVEGRAYVFHTPDRYVSQEEISGGLTVFF